MTEKGLGPKIKIQILGLKNPESCAKLYQKEEGNIGAQYLLLDWKSTKAQRLRYIVEEIGSSSIHLVFEFPNAG